MFLRTTEKIKIKRKQWTTTKFSRITEQQSWQLEAKDHRRRQYNKGISDTYYEGYQHDRNPKKTEEKG